MSIEEIRKIELPVRATPETMSLLIKAKHFFTHATLHAQSGNGFDSMIAIHSLDNSIEYLLRIIIKHLEIEEKLSKTLSTPELMALFSETDKFLKGYTLLDGKPIGLPYESEIRQIRNLRNNVQHGMILPISELRDFIKYGDKFFEKVLKKIFGLTLQEISYSTLVEDTDIKRHLVVAEVKISEGAFLEAVVACRDAFELAQFVLQNQRHHVNKMAAIPHIKKDSIELYYYIQNLDEEISILGTNINIADYRRFARYVDHIPGQYRAEKSGYSVMQRDWEKNDADFCYAFASQAILNWQLTREKPLYEIDLSAFRKQKNVFSINEILLPELYVEKSCVYFFDDNRTGELLLIREDTKNALQKILPGDICKFHRKIINTETNTIIREYTYFAIIDVIEMNLVLNDGPLWELVLYYREIPFTTTGDKELQIDIDDVLGLIPKTKDEELLKKIISEFGPILNAEKAFELNDLLISNNLDTFDLISSNLISEMRPDVAKYRSVLRDYKI